MAPALRDRPGDRLVAVAVQGQPDRGVPPHGDLLGRGAGGDPQRHDGVAKIVDVQALQVGCLGAGTQERARKPGTRSGPHRRR
jgi:hypothetical protein